MDQLGTFSDERLSAFCAYCGGPPTTRDHVPSKVFLDEPYPPNLPVVPVCMACNASLSLDEEYVACFLECVLCGSTSSDSLKRDKVRKILERNRRLASRIESARVERKNGVSLWKVEEPRLATVLMKLARGHLAYELAELRLDSVPSTFTSPLSTMTEQQRISFESALRRNILPEIGSRGFLRMVKSSDTREYFDWQIVQAGRYRYLAAVSRNLLVRFVLSEYLACEVIW
jgi:hypothetical protein